MRIKRNRLFLFVGLGVVGLMLKSSGFNLISVIVLLGLTYLLLRFVTSPLSLLIARIGYSIRWKFEIAIAAIAALVLAVGLISFDAMDFMHKGLHDIQDIGSNQPLAVLRAVDDLEDTQHGPLFTLMPVFSVLGVIVAATVGAAMAWSVIGPVRRMSEAMHRIASGISLSLFRSRTGTNWESWPPRSTTPQSSWPGSRKQPWLTSGLVPCGSASPR